MRVLVQRGADIDTQDSNQWTPLMVAAMNGNYPVVSLLIREGANLQLEAKDGKTARNFAEEAFVETSAKASGNLKLKRQNSDLRKIINLLPGGDDEDLLTPKQYDSPMSKFDR